MLIDKDRLRTSTNEKHCLGINIKLEQVSASTTTSCLTHILLDEEEVLGKCQCWLLLAGWSSKFIYKSIFELMIISLHKGFLCRPSFCRTIRKTPLYSLVALGLKRGDSSGCLLKFLSNKQKRKGLTKPVPSNSS